MMMTEEEEEGKLSSETLFSEPASWLACLFISWQAN